ncbi:MAG: right-handed parallel beta-helix repeat-containing protein [Legionellaceae bacterium]|nr:right-handed parallel beta-helix repeat-containing protein [Legionellaceae bacterium]
MLNKKINLKSIVGFVSVGFLVAGCGGGSESGSTAAGVASVSTGSDYGTSVDSTDVDYNVIVADDAIVGARLIATGAIPDASGDLIEATVCEGFTEIGKGKYTLNNCKAKPSYITAIGGFMDTNGNGVLDVNESTQSAPLITSTAILGDEVLSVNPLATLAGFYSGSNVDILANKLGFGANGRALAFKASAENQPLNRKVNAILSAASDNGIEIKAFSRDFAAKIVASSATGDNALKEAINSFATDPNSDTQYGEAAVESFIHDSRVQAVLNGTDALSAMVAKNVPDGKLQISGLVTTSEAGANIVGGATVELYLGTTKLGSGVSDSYGKYSINVDEKALLGDSTLSLNAQPSGVLTSMQASAYSSSSSSWKYKSSVSTNTVLNKRVNGRITSSQVDSLTLSDLTTATTTEPVTTTTPVTTTPPVTTTTPVTTTAGTCGKDQYYRIQSKECLPLENPTWGFQGFTVPAGNVYQVPACTQKALQDTINAVPAAGGTVNMPACTINTVDGISINNSNVILQGAGMGKTILNDTVSLAFPNSSVNLRGQNIIVRNFTVNGNGKSLNGINGYTTKGNVLVEYIEAKNFKPDQGAGIAFMPSSPLLNSRLTIRYNKASNGLHGIDVKVQTSAKTLIYSNEVFGNKNYGLDTSTDENIEIAGNYMHHNVVAGAKAPLGNNIIYHNNDINFNGTTAIGAGLVYMGSNPIGIITVKDNNIANNVGAAFACWSSNFSKLILKNNIVTGSTDANGYNINGYGVKTIDVTGDHGKFWTNATVVKH